VDSRDFDLEVLTILVWGVIIMKQLNRRRRTAVWVMALTGASALAISPSFAQAAGDSQAAAPAPAGDQSASEGLGDIVVTAQRRNENIQKVPITVQTFTASQLVKNGITNTIDLAMVTPGLVYGRGVGLGSPFLRGIGTPANGPGTENSVAIYVDGVYYATKSSAITDLEGSDVARVEVLSGPQGTLFGRNASGGLIQVVTTDPSIDPALTVKAGYGNYDTVKASVYGNAPLTEALAVNLAAFYSNQGDGWGTNFRTGNPVNRSDNFSIRSKIKWTPSASTAITLAGDYAYLNTSNGVALQPVYGLKPAIGPVYPGDTYGVDADHEPNFRSRNGGISLKVDQDLSFAKLLSITAWRDGGDDFLLDNHYTPIPFLTTTARDRERQLSQELQLSGGSPSTLQWTTGVYLFDYDGNRTFLNGGAFNPSVRRAGVYGRARVSSEAIYGQVTKALLPGTRLTLGGRYTWETRKLNGHSVSESLTGVVTNGTETAQKKNFAQPSWRVSLEHDFAQDIMGYVSYNRGFKSGQYNITSLAAPAVKPEIVDSYEAGLKTTFLDHKVRFNVSGFYSNFRDIQLTSFATAGAIALLNAARAKIYGVDAQTEVAITPQLRLTGAAEWLHARYTSFPGAPFAVPNLVAGGNGTMKKDGAGNTLIRAPNFSANAGVSYSVPVKDGSIDLNVNYAFTSKVFQEVDNYLSVPALSLVNAQLAWTHGKYKVSLWGRNLTNKFYYTNINANNLASQGSPAAPRTYGITLEAKLW
jgi:iron complex outermembrane receptor protein